MAHIKAGSDRTRHKCRHPNEDELPALYLRDAGLLCLPLPTARGNKLRYDDMPLADRLIDAVHRYRDELAGVCWLYAHKPPVRFQPDPDWLKAWLACHFVTVVKLPAG